MGIALDVYQYLPHPIASLFIESIGRVARRDAGHSPKYGLRDKIDSHICANGSTIKWQMMVMS